MTVADNTSRNQYSATAGQTIFSYTFEIVDKDDLVVLQNGTTLSEGTDYSVAGVGDNSGGTITLTAGATLNDIMTLYRDMPYARNQNYTNSGDFLASDVNDDFDNLWLAGEQTNRSFDQSVRRPITDSTTISMELPDAATRANKYLSFSPTGAVTATTTVPPGITDAALVTYTPGGTGAVDTTVEDKLRETISADDFGTVGDGDADDTVKLQKAVNYVTATGAWLDGGNKTYKITDTINATGEFLRLRNFKFVMQTTYSGTGRFECKRATNTNKMTVAFENIFVDGGRGTYKTGSEPWTDMDVDLFGYDSIAPTLGAFLKVESYNSDTTVHVTNCLFENYHGIAGVRVNSFGTTVIQGCVFKNMSFQSFITYQAYFDANDVITYQEGTTLVSDVYAEDIGLLPDNFLVDGAAKTFSNTDYAPHTAYNFAAIGANYNISNATVKNYASTGVLGDRNKIFNASNIIITNDSDRSFSNNPSGAFWIEACEQSNVNNLTVEVTARAARDTLEDVAENPRGLDNSLLQIYLKDGNKAFFSNVFLKTSSTQAYVNKIIRGSSQHNTLCSITNFHVEGTCRNPADAISFLLLPGSQIQQDVNLAHGYLASGGIKVDNPHNLTIDDVYLTGDVLPFRAANASGETRDANEIRATNTYKIVTTGTTDFTAIGAADSNVGTVFIATGAGTGTGTAQLFIPDETHNVSIVNSYIGGNITNTTKLTESFNVVGNKYIDYITSLSQGATAKIVVSDNAHIGGGISFANANVTGPSSVKIQGNGLIEGVTRVDGTNNAIISNNNTERTITIEDVQHFQVIGNTAKTDAAEPCIYVNPTTPSDILSGVINGNSCLVKTGTSGAGHVSIASGVTNVMEGVNNKLTVAWL